MKWNLNKIKNQYTKLAQVYGLSTYLRFRFFFIGNPSNFRKKAVEKLNLKQGDNVLDLVCCTGANFKLLDKKTLVFYEKVI
jgi:ubiquinone/menaquinone biosynthesis C-methylase UbiE